MLEADAVPRGFALHRPFQHLPKLEVYPGPPETRSRPFSAEKPLSETLFSHFHERSRFTSAVSEMRE